MLKQPFRGYFATGQKFGQNFNGYYKSEGLLGHGGLDIPMPTGTPIIAPADGLVIYVSDDLRRGLGVSIMTDDIFQWEGKDCRFSCVHWHLKEDSIVVKVGDKVKTGDLLGLSNNTGQSTGPHLHFGLAPLSPDGSRKLLADGNGFKGMIDPLPYLEFEAKPETPKIIKTKELQSLLNKWGAKLKIDGVYGQKSKKALADFLK